MKKYLNKIISLFFILLIISIARICLSKINTPYITTFRSISNQNLNQIAKGFLIAEINNETTFSKKFHLQQGLKSVTDLEKENMLYIDGLLIENTTKAYEPLAKYNGKHPYNSSKGFYAFNALYSNGNVKEKFDSEARIAMEIYPWENEGDGLVGVVFGDGRVITLKPTTSSTAIDIQTLLSIRGENDGKLY